jgi:hypothetical protein
MLRVVTRFEQGRKNLADVWTVDEQVKLYIEYLEILREVCNEKYSIQTFRPDTLSVRYR